MGHRKVGEFAGVQPIATIPHNAPLSRACALFRQDQTNLLAVVDRRRLTGVLSESDIVRRALGGTAPLAGMTVGEIMTRRPATTDVQESLHTAYTLMKSRGIRYLPVLKEAVPIGILTLGSIPISDQLAFEQDTHAAFAEVG